MTRRPQFWVALLCVGIVLLAAYSISVERAREVAVPAPKVAAEAPPVALDSYADSYRRGTHTVSGSVAVPTPCYVVTAAATTDASSTPERIRVDISAPPDTGSCLMLPDTKPFSVTATAPADADISLYVNGALATTTGAQAAK